MKPIKILLGIIGVILAIFVGGFLDFYPCIGNDLIAREIQFCTIIICSVIIICTYYILNK